MTMRSIIAGYRCARGLFRVRALVTLACVLVWASPAVLPAAHADTGPQASARADQLRHGLPQASMARAPASAGSVSITADALLAKARQALGRGHLLAPAGHNAFEFYLRALRRDPHNVIAQRALEQAFPYAVDMAGQAISLGHLTAAAREIHLLAQARPDSPVVRTLRSRLAIRRHASQPRQLPPTTTAPESGPSSPTTGTTQSTHAANAAGAKPAAQRDRAAVKIHGVSPRYPEAARQAHRQGWVEVRFVVGTDGHVHDARIVADDPPGLFDRAVLDAVAQWVYRPAVRDGQAVAVKIQQRINFHLTAH